MAELAVRIRQIRWELTEDVANQHELSKQQKENVHWMVEEIYDRCQCHADWFYISCLVCDWLEELGDYEVKETDIDEIIHAVEI